MTFVYNRIVNNFQSQIRNNDIPRSRFTLYSIDNNTCENGNDLDFLKNTQKFRYGITPKTDKLIINAKIISFIEQNTIRICKYQNKNNSDGLIIYLRLRKCLKKKIYCILIDWCTLGYHFYFFDKIDT
jgi:hypothetical protein